MKQQNMESRLFSIHSPPVDDEWIAYTQYMARLLDGRLHYYDSPDDKEIRERSVRDADVILVHQPRWAWWQRALERAPLDRLAATGPTSTLFARRPRWPLRHIIFIFRCEPADKVAGQWTRRLAQAAGATVTILPVLPVIPARYTTSSDGRPSVAEFLAAGTLVAARLHRLLEQFSSQDVATTVQLRAGEPLWQMREEMTEYDYDLAVISAEPAVWLHRALVGDLVRPLLRCANCPVFVARGRSQPEFKGVGEKLNRAGQHKRPVHA